MENNVPETNPSNTKRYAGITGIVIVAIIALALIFAPEAFMNFLMFLYIFG